MWDWSHRVERFALSECILLSYKGETVHRQTDGQTDRQKQTDHNNPLLSSSVNYMKPCWQLPYVSLQLHLATSQQQIPLLIPFPHSLHTQTTHLGVKPSNNKYSEVLPGLMVSKFGIFVESPLCGLDTHKWPGLSQLTEVVEQDIQQQLWSLV